MKVSISVKITADLKRDEDGEVLERDDLASYLYDEVEMVLGDIDQVDDYVVEQITVARLGAELRA